MCVYVFVHACVCNLVCVCVCVCIHVCMYVCMYVCIHVCVCIGRREQIPCVYNNFMLMCFFECFLPQIKRVKDAEEVPMVCK